MLNILHIKIFKMSDQLENVIKYQKYDELFRITDFFNKKELLESVKNNIGNSVIFDDYIDFLKENYNLDYKENNNPFKDEKDRYSYWREVLTKYYFSNNYNKDIISSLKSDVNLSTFKTQNIEDIDDINIIKTKLNNLIKLTDEEIPELDIEIEELKKLKENKQLNKKLKQLNKKLKQLQETKILLEAIDINNELNILDTLIITEDYKSIYKELYTKIVNDYKDKVEDIEGINILFIQPLFTIEYELSKGDPKWENILIIPLSLKKFLYENYEDLYNNMKIEYLQSSVIYTMNHCENLYGEKDRCFDKENVSNIIKDYEGNIEKINNINNNNFDIKNMLIKSTKGKNKIVSSAYRAGIRNAIYKRNNQLKLNEIDEEIDVNNKKINSINEEINKILNEKIPNLNENKDYKDKLDNLYTNNKDNKLKYILEAYKINETKFLEKLSLPVKKRYYQYKKTYFDYKDIYRNILLIEKISDDTLKFLGLDDNKINELEGYKKQYQQNLDKINELQKLVEENENNKTNVLEFSVLYKYQYAYNYLCKLEYIKSGTIFNLGHIISALEIGERRGFGDQTKGLSNIYAELEIANQIHLERSIWDFMTTLSESILQTNVVGCYKDDKINECKFNPERTNIYDFKDKMLISQDEDDIIKQKMRLKQLLQNKITQMLNQDKGKQFITQSVKKKRKGVYEDEDDEEQQGKKGRRR